ncbi:restriction endonuclease subunit S [Porphyromonas canoris]|uniref:Type I restriction modification DNA specificity domain-containing protein n=1 Tax=Porphyromonas canoris TaxID=36875 RepID=A0ABR4XK86_9PORP|nr:restriction endonuclease subunit S [Porphyromonas canoris]KGN92098.1 hypothetical protein HQ43_08675 [Porphyromonas canoris]
MATINKIPKCPPLRFPQFSDDWQIVPLKGMCELYSGNTPDRTNEAYFNGDINWFSSGELKDRYLHMSNEKISQQAVESVGLKILPPNTLVIAIYGLEASGVRGNCAIIGTSGTISQACMAFIPKVGVMNEYLYSWYQRFGNYIGLKYAQGTKQQNLSSDIIGNLSVAHPTLKEQSKIVCFFRLIDEHIANLSETIKELKTQKAGLLNQLFSQKLRFPDFNDEWTQCFVSDFGQVVTGSTPPTSDSCNYDASDYLWASPSDLGQTKYIRKTKTMLSSKGFSLTRSLPLGSVLVSCIGIIGKVGVAVTEMSTNQQINAIIPNQSKVNSEYVYYAILNKSLAYSRLSATQVVPILSKREFERMRNQYPSLAEQKKIADFLSLIDERIEVEEQLLKKYEEQKKYLLRKMFV